MPLGALTLRVKIHLILLTAVWVCDIDYPIQGRHREAEWPAEGSTARARPGRLTLQPAPEPRTCTLTRFGPAESAPLCPGISQSWPRPSTSHQMVLGRPKHHVVLLTLWLSEGVARVWPARGLECHHALWLGEVIQIQDAFCGAGCLLLHPGMQAPQTWRRKMHGPVVDEGQVGPVVWLQARALLGVLCPPKGLKYCNVFRSESASFMWAVSVWPAHAWGRAVRLGFANPHS